MGLREREREGENMRELLPPRGGKPRTRMRKVEYKAGGRRASSNSLVEVQGQHRNSRAYGRGGRTVQYLTRTKSRRDESKCCAVVGELFLGS